MVGPRPGDGLRNLAIGLRGRGLIQDKGPTIGNSAFRWGLDGWEAAIHGSFSFPPMSNAISNSLGYALVALLVALPLGYLLAATIHRLERTKPLLSRALDISTMLPFALSAAMVGLGVLIGVIRLNPQSLHQFWPLPSLAHVMLTTLRGENHPPRVALLRQEIRGECHGAGHGGVCEVPQDQACP